MTEAVHAWLPPVAIFDGSLASRFDEILQLWARQWLPGSVKVASKVSGATMWTSNHGEQWCTPCGSLIFAADQQRKVRLASALLGLAKSWHKSDPHDAVLLGKLAHAALLDLSASLSPLFQNKPSIELLGEEADRLPSAMSIGVSSGSGRLFDISVSWEAAVTARKSLISSPRKPHALQSRREAIATQKIRVGGYVGSGRIGLSDLRALSPGDVLVLDRTIGDDFDVTIDGRAIAQDGYEIKRDGAELVLQLKRKAQSSGVV